MQALSISPTRVRGDGSQNHHLNGNSYDHSPSQHQVLAGPQPQALSYLPAAKPYMGPESFTVNDISHGFNNLAVGPSR
jgi:hypothetical protein